MSSILDGILKYQVLAYAPIGILLVCLQIYIAFSQSQISKGQLVLAAESAAQRKAAAEIAVDNAIVPLFAIYPQLLALGAGVTMQDVAAAHSAVAWAPILKVAKEIKTDWDLSRLVGEATIAFPKYAAEINQTLRAASMIQQHGIELDDRKWSMADKLPLKVTNAFGQFLRSMNQIAPILPHNRSADV